jgi:hypothetical protein
VGSDLRAASNFRGDHTMTEPLDETIKARAATDAQFAVAYALLKIAEALAIKTTQGKRQKTEKPEPDANTLIG